VTWITRDVQAKLTARETTYKRLARGVRCTLVPR
jgi:hypothetical protein